MPVQIALLDIIQYVAAPSPNDKIGKLALPSFSRHARVNEFPLVIWLIENVAVVLLSETWRHLGIAHASMALLSVCTSFPCEDLLSGIFFLLFSISLFPVCFF